MSGPWDTHYATATELRPYGDDLSYLLAAAWVDGCNPIEDWGCGLGWLRNFIDPAAYRGIDASATPFADLTADLTMHRSQAEGIVLRHVLEHSYNWPQILDNAVASFSRRLCIVLFTPLVAETSVLHTEPDYGDVPVIAFNIDDLLAHLPTDVNVETIDSPAHPYGVETLLRVAR